MVSVILTVLLSIVFLFLINVDVDIKQLQMPARPQHVQNKAGKATITKTLKQTHMSHRTHIYTSRKDSRIEITSPAQSGGVRADVAGGARSGAAVSFGFDPRPICWLNGSFNFFYFIHCGIQTALFNKLGSTRVFLWKCIVESCIPILPSRSIQLPLRIPVEFGTLL